MAETHEFFSFRPSRLLFLNVLGFAEPHESTRPVTSQRERACGCTTFTNSVGLPVVAILATPGCGRPQSSQEPEESEEPEGLEAAGWGMLLD